MIHSELCIACGGPLQLGVVLVCPLTGFQILQFIQVTLAYGGTLNVIMITSCYMKYIISICIVQFIHKYSTHMVHSPTYYLSKQCNCIQPQGTFVFRYTGLQIQNW